ncbi:MAG: RlmE family RNA methyltransferase [Rhodospirillales bacterium]|jgi:23S rRNA (uridine2552-2'-O)-methyltransferase|nr:RlmE family RNA methyltransferase [Rhodospirillales bacterium]
MTDPRKRAERGSRLSGRGVATRVRTAKGRKSSSTRWLQRQLNDPYVAEAKKRGFRSRAAFKLMEMDDRFGFLKTGGRVVDLGAAPGGWSQVAIERLGPAGHVIALDINAMEPLAGAQVLQADFLDPAAPGLIVEVLGGPADVVLSDMAAPTTGHPPTDHLRIMALLEAALDFAGSVLTPGGAFVAKVFQGGSERELLARMKRDFASVRHCKPPASRKESPELYVVAQGFRGSAPPPDGTD